MDVDLPNSLKRCLSAPIINNLTATTAAPSSAAAVCSNNITVATTNIVRHIPDQYQLNQQIQKKVLDSLLIESRMTSTTIPQASSTCSSPQRPQSREHSPAPILNIFAPRARRYSASFTTMGGGIIGNAGTVGTGPRLTPRVSQLRQEECIDINSREINHEREVHCAMQISQSWEDLTLVAENWSCKSEDMTNPLQVTLPPVTGFGNNCSSPSPNSRTGMRLPYGLSPSPTRRTFATRRSMSPIAMRPSQLGPVKRKFELDDGNLNSYSPPPLKKIFTESRGPSPICQSPDSGTYEGRITPKLLSKLCTSSASATNSVSSMCSSPGSILDAGIDMQSNASSSSSSVNQTNLTDKNEQIFTSSTDSTEPLDCVVNNLNIKINNKIDKNIKNQINEDTIMLDDDKITSSDDRILQEINKLPKWQKKFTNDQQIISDSSESESSSSYCGGGGGGVSVTGGNNKSIFSYHNNLIDTNKKIAGQDCNLVSGNITTIDNNTA